MFAIDVASPPEARKKDFRSYFVWIVGKVPDIAIEIVSDKRGGEDTDKLEGYLWVAFDPRKQGWHDKMANSVVVRRRR